MAHNPPFPFETPCGPGPDLSVCSSTTERTRRCKIRTCASILHRWTTSLSTHCSGCSPRYKGGRQFAVVELADGVSSAPKADAKVTGVAGGDPSRRRYRRSLPNPGWRRLERRLRLPQRYRRHRRPCRVRSPIWRSCSPDNRCRSSKAALAPHRKRRCTSGSHPSFRRAPLPPARRRCSIRIQGGMRWLAAETQPTDR
jgi:hypothetical protein